MLSKPDIRVSDSGELELIRRLARIAGKSAGLRVGIGDDCAVARLPAGRRDLLLKSDPVIEGVHFARNARAASIGHKAVGRVLSDFAAMGGEPAWLLINLVAAPGESVRRLEAIYRGAVRLAEKHGAAIAGGDVSSGPRLELHVFGAGYVPAGQALTRAGARTGDVLLVTGRLGGSISGRHLTFDPRVKEGVWLRRTGQVHAMIDLSDGLATDLRHLCNAGNVGAVVNLDALPLAAAVRQMKDKRSAWEHALTDGEDFELLFAVPARAVAVLEKKWPFETRLTRIGHITASRDILLRRPDGTTAPLESAGFEHFWFGRKSRNDRNESGTQIDPPGPDADSESGATGSVAAPRRQAGCLRHH